MVSNSGRTHWILTICLPLITMLALVVVVVAYNGSMFYCHTHIIMSMKTNHYLY